MSWGTDAKEMVETDLADTDITTPLTLVTRAYSGTSDGGYSQTAYSTSSTSTIYAIPTTYYNNKINYAKFGNLSTGALTFLVSADVTVNKQDQVVYSSGTFNVVDINPVLISDTIIANEVVLQKDL